MLKSGLLLLFVSSIGVTLRSFELVELNGPAFKMGCSFTLLISLFCFLGTYFVEFAHNKPALRK